MTFILFIIIVTLLFWISSVSGRVAALEEKLAGNKVVVSSSEQASVPSMPKPEEYNAALTHSQGLKAFAESVLPATVPAEHKTSPEKESEAMETVFTTSWLNKIGVVALLLGMVFFFKYAIDQGWITPWLRIIIGFVVGGLLIYLGHLWRGKYGSRAYALSGGGIALLYFTIYAAYQFYVLMPQAAAYICIVGVAVLSVWLSFLYSSLTLGMLGFFGAYGAPIMLSSGTDQQIQLFAYISILNIAVLAILSKKFWLELLALALVGTTIDFALWGGSYSSQANTISSIFFVILTTILFVLGLAALTYYHRTKNSIPGNFDKNAAVVAFLSGLFFFTSSVLLLTNTYHSMLASVMLLGGVLFFFAYALVDRMEFAGLNYSLASVASVLLVFAAGWQWHEKALALAWLALALIGLTLGALVKREELRTWGALILFLALFKSVIEPYTSLDHVFLLNAKFGLMFASTLSLLYAGWLYEKYPSKDPSQHIESVFEVVAAVLLWFGVSWDITSAIATGDGLWHTQWIVFWWIVFPTALAFLAFAAKRSYLLATAVVLTMCGFIRVVAMSYGDNPAFLLNAKFGLMFAESLSLLFIANLYSRKEGKNGLSDVLKVVSSLLLWFSVSWELVEYFRYYDSANVRNLLLSLWWIVYAVILLVAGSVWHSPLFRKVSFGLFSWLS